MYCFNRRNRGFSLAELAIALAIVGVILGGVMSVAVTDGYHVKANQTNARIDQIEAALAGFIVQNHRLPCPADGTLALTPDNNNAGNLYGKEDPGCAQNFAFNVDGATASVGVVPVRTLQLPDRFMFDGWDRRIMYVVQNKYTSNDCGDPDDRNSCFLNSDPGALTINDEDGNIIANDNIYVLISYGTDGYGAFSRTGGATRLDPYGDNTTLDRTLQEDNAAMTAGFDANFSKRNYVKSDTDLFDDILRYKSKNELIFASGSVLFEPICQDAATVINRPENNICDGLGVDFDGTTESAADGTLESLDEKRCLSFAVKINQLCMGL